MLDIRHEILQYLSDNHNGTLIPLNNRLIELLGTQPVRILKGILRDMAADKVAEISGNYGWLGSSHASVEQNLHNQPINGRILSSGYKELQNSIAQNTQITLSLKQIDDFNKTIWYRKQNFIWFVIGVAIAIIFGLLGLLSNKN